VAETLPAGKKFDIILANINKSVILGNATAISNALKPGGRVLLSGLLSSDRSDIENVFVPLLGEPEAYGEKNNWLILSFKKGALRN
jgi:ribosomal protein L11 methyltransferase